MRRPTFLIIGLLVSVALNVFAVAFLAGQWSQRDARVELGNLLPASAELRQSFRAELADNRAEIIAVMGKLHHARAAVQAAAKGVFDRAALETALAELRGATQELQTIGHSALLAALEKAEATTQ